ncbi:condensation domain-containing protein, partial [Nonomuraea sp. NPDC050556]|uniref:condensation domain-containing protein n=1 Tax=Nonomuraea sp. NPDC050556 TaxID=3364369 RepID=UPI0037BD2502
MTGLDSAGLDPAIAALLEALTPQQRAVLQARLATGPDNRRVRASASQRRLWFLSQWDTNSASYHVAQSWRLSGYLDLGALKEAFDHVVARHRPLRTTFELTEENLYQIVHNPAPVPFDIADTSTEPDPQASAEQLSRAHRQRPFDLDTAPLLRVLLVRLRPDDYVLSLVLHHLTCDAWSIGVLYEDVATAYAHLRAGRQPSLPPLPVQYTDVALWEHSQEVGDELLDFWRTAVSGLEPVELPTDHPRPDLASGAGASIPLHLDTDLTVRIRQFAVDEGVTVFMVLMASLQVLLLRYTGQEDFAVGIPIAGRTARDTERLVGPFFNVLPVRSDARGSLTFRELVRRVRQRVLDVFAHQQAPFDRLVDLADADRHPGRHPLFQVTLAVQNVPNDVLTLDGMQARFLPLPSDTSKLDLAFVLAEDADGITGQLEWATELFESDTAAALRTRWLDIIDAALAEPQCPMRELPMSGGMQPIGSPGTGGTLCLHELFEEWVGRVPGAVAVVGAGGVLTYGEL